VLPAEGEVHGVDELVRAGWEVDAALRRSYFSSGWVGLVMVELVLARGS